MSEFDDYVWEAVRNLRVLCWRLNRNQVVQGVTAEVIRAVFAAADSARLDGRDELILRHRCGCDVCANTPELCPASASALAMERTRSESADARARLEEMLTFLLDHAYNVPKNWRERINVKTGDTSERLQARPSNEDC